MAKTKTTKTTISARTSSKAVPKKTLVAGRGTHCMGYAETLVSLRRLGGIRNIFLGPLGQWLEFLQPNRKRFPLVTRLTLGISTLWIGQGTWKQEIAYVSRYAVLTLVGGA